MVTRRGDLRTQWNECCCLDDVCRVEPVNWPVRFGTRTTLCEDSQKIYSGIDIEHSADSTNLQTGGEPLPLLVAAEWIDGHTVQHPDSSGQPTVDL